MALHPTPGNKAHTSRT